MLNLDKYDKKLLYELDLNARQSYLGLAKKIGLSKDAVKYRINNYLSSGLLSGFYALIDASKLGYYVLRIYLDFRNTDTAKEKEIIDFLISQKNIFAVIRTEVECNMAIGFWAKKLSDFTDFWSKFRNKYSRHITNERYSIFTEYNRFQRNYLVNEKIQRYHTMKEPRRENLDEKDLLILELLAKDARIQIIDIAEKIRLTSKAVINRIRDLERRKIILRYLPRINIEKIGYSIYKTDIMINNQEKIREIKEIIFNLPNIVESESAFGGSDFEFDLEVKDFAEYESVISSLKEQYGQYIESIRYYRSLHVHKMVFLPVL